MYTGLISGGEFRTLRMIGVFMLNAIFIDKIEIIYILLNIENQRQNAKKQQLS